MMRNRLGAGWLLLFWLLPLCGPAAENQARAALVRGDVTVRVGEGGAPRPLKKDDPVVAGDVVITGPKGLAQLVFPDQSVVYVKAGSEVKIEAFHFAADRPEEDQAVTEALKGGMRALSGIAGKRNPDSVEIKTRVSTIGIRGTAIDIEEAGADYLVTFDFGQGYVKNDAGRIDLGTGESARVSARKPPALARLEKRKDDPSQLARYVAQLNEQGLEAWAKRQAEGIGGPCDEQRNAGCTAVRDRRLADLYFTVGMLRESRQAAPERLGRVVRGLNQGLAADDRPGLTEFTTRVYPAQAEQILKSSALNKDELGTSLEAVMRGLEDQPRRLVDGVFEKAIQLGVTKEQAERILENLKNNPAPCR